MIETTIIGLGARGDGIAEIEGARIHIPFALPGERVQLSRDGARGTLETLLSTAPERIAPFCPYFGTCGGCQLQHLAPLTQLAFKHGLVVDALTRAGLDTEIAPTLAALGGRQRATLHVRDGKAGYMRPRSHDILDIEACPILVPGLAGVPAMARAFGRLAGDCEVHAVMADGIDLAIRAKRRIKPEMLVALVRKLPGVARLAFNGEVVYQNAEPFYTIGRARVPLPVEGFLQPSREGEAALAGLVTRAMPKSKRIADLFCGIGTFALRLADTAQVYAADGEKSAILALERAVRHTPGLKKVTAKARDLFREPLVPVELKDFDAVVFDPPRAGAEAQARELARSKVPLVVGVSCDPVTFARDAQILVAGGYRLTRVTPVDQFAHSPHVELVGIFER